MASITAAGTGSGLDIETIIETLTEAERTPTETRLANREIQIQANISAYGSLKGALKDFQEALSGLSSLQELAARSASSSKEDLFTVSAGAGAAVGSTSIEVTQLASNHKLVSKASFASPTTAVGAGTMNISMGGKSFGVTIVGGQNNTLAGIRDAINDAADNPGVTASILNYSDGAGGTISKLVFTADDTGAANNITVSVTGDSDGNDTDNVGLSSFIFTDKNNGNMDEKSAAQDAMLLLDNEYPVTSATNEFANAIQGVTITAKSASPGETGTLNVGLDKSAISGKLAEFVDAFNALSDALAYLTDYDTSTNEAGLLTGDFAARTIETQIRRTVSSALDGVGQFNTLASIGITTQRDGSLKLDSSKLNTALANNFDDVAQLLGGDDGIFTKLDEKVDDFLASDGLIASRNNTFLAQLKDIDAQRERLTLRVESFQERIRKQYTNLDILVGQLQSTGDFVTQQLETISAGLTGKKK